jgi:D-tyrosyl-tRNA(Tyr) deacylase
MRLVIQRVNRASVTVGEQQVSAIGQGMLVLVGIRRGDTEETARQLARKTVELRIFEDAAGLMNRSLLETGGELLAVSQFTLYADARRGRRPSFAKAAPAEAARPIFEAFCQAVEDAGVPCRRGAFGAEMLVELINDGR